MDKIKDVGILLVGNDHVSSLNIKRMLNTIGFTHIAHEINCTDAISTIIKDSPNLILIEIFRYEKSKSYETALKIRKYTNVPIVYIAEKIDKTIFENANFTHPYSLILKPLNYRELYSCIDTALQQYYNEKNIIESKERYRTIIENVHEGIVIIKDSKIEYCNSHFLKLLECESSLIDDQTIFRFIHPDDKEYFFSRLRKIIYSKKAQDIFPLKLITVSNLVKQVVINSSYIKWGTLPAVLMFVNKLDGHDVVCKKHQEHSPDQRQSTRRIYFLYTIEKLFNEYSMDIKEILQIITNLLPGAMLYPDYASAQIMFEDLLISSSEFQKTELAIQCSIIILTEKRGHVTVSYSKMLPDKDYGPFLDEEMDLIIELSLQFSKYYEIRLLINKHQMLSLIVDTSREAIIFCDTDSTILGWNKGAEQMFGYEECEIMGKNIKCIIPENLYHESDNFFKTLIAGKNIYRQKTVRMKKDGTFFSVVLSIVPLKDVTNKITGFSAIIDDISHQMELERLFMEESFEMRKIIGATLHDRLGQMLTSASLFANAITKRKNDVDTTIHEYAKKIQFLINDSIDITRALSHGLIPVDIKNISLEDALRDFGHDVELSFDIKCSVCVSRGTEDINTFVATQLLHIAQEAVRNAIFHGKAKHISILMESKQYRNQLKIIDDGIGFSKNSSKHMGIGIKIMEYRANLIGAKINFLVNTNAGCSVTCTIT